MAIYSAPWLQLLTIRPFHHQIWTFEGSSFFRPCTFCPFSPNETAFSSFIFFVRLIQTTALCPPPNLYSYPTFTFHTCSSKFTCIQPIPLSKPFYHAETACCVLPENRSLPFIARISLSLSWMHGINSIYLACSFHCRCTNGNVLRTVYLSKFFEKDSDK